MSMAILRQLSLYGEAMSPKTAKHLQIASICVFADLSRVESCIALIESLRAELALVAEQAVQWQLQRSRG